MRIVGGQSHNGAVVLLTDIYGVHQQETQSVAARIADMTLSAVFIPDVFQGDPWPKDEEAGVCSSSVV